MSKMAAAAIFCRQDLRRFASEQPTQRRRRRLLFWRRRRRRRRRGRASKSGRGDASVVDAIAPRNDASKLSLVAW